jgi:hypothetical protein
MEIFFICLGICALLGAILGAIFGAFFGGKIAVLTTLLYSVTAVLGGAVPSMAIAVGIHFLNGGFNG